MTFIYGFILIFISAVFFGAIPIFTEFLYRESLNSQSVLFFRFAIAAVIMWILVFLLKKKMPEKRDLITLFLLGFLGYAGQSFSYFKALVFIPPSLVSILLYLYPVIVTLISIFVLKERITLRKITALILAVGGTILVIGFKKGSDIRGILLGISAAVIYSVYIITSSDVLKRNNALSSTAVIFSSASLFFFGFCMNTELILPSTSFGWTNIFLLSVVATSLAAYSFFEGIRLIGAVNSSMLSTFEPVATIFLTAAVFNYRITLLQGGGTLLIILSAILLSLRDKSAEPATEAAGF